MSEIVEIWHEEPFTNSIAVAEGTEIQHKNVMELVRKHADSLVEFGSLAFETRKCGDSAFETRNSQGRPTEVALLNEPQATLLLTFMRNSETVIRFKVALVRAFFDLRAQLARSQPHATLSHNPAHAADQIVSADRIFRSAMRTARTAGVPTARALRVARELAQQRTGIDLFCELQISESDLTPRPGDSQVREAFRPSHVRFAEQWMNGQTPFPFSPCSTLQLHRAFLWWAKRDGEQFPVGVCRFVPDLVREFGWRRKVPHLNASAGPGVSARQAFIMPDPTTLAAKGGFLHPDGMGVSQYLSDCYREFQRSLDATL